MYNDEGGGGGGGISTKLKTVFGQFLRSLLFLKEWSVLGIKIRHHANGACRTPQWFDKMSVTSTGIGAMFSFQASGEN